MFSWYRYNNNVFVFLIVVFISWLVIVYLYDFVMDIRLC